MSTRFTSPEVVLDCGSARGETETWAARRGVWRAEVVLSWEWRKGKRLGGTRTTARQESGGRCNIKGNISRNGTRIYHAPGGRYYDQTQINTTKGSGGSAPRTRHERRDGAARGNSPHALGAAHQRPRFGGAAIVAGRRNRVPRSVPDISRGADATLFEADGPDRRLEARPE